jgi:hypothetical protein
MITLPQIAKCENLSFLLGLEADSSVNIKGSYMAALCNDIRRELPALIEVNEDEADVQSAIAVMGRVAVIFQRIIDELSRPF